MRRLLVAAAFAALAVAGSASAESPAYPTRPIRLVVPTGAGGITDILARVLAQKLGLVLKGSVVIENKPGASGVVGTAYVARAKPDGYTLLMAFPSHVINPSTISNLPYNTQSDFAPISKVGSVAEILLVQANSPFKNAGDLVAAAKMGPGSLSYGSVGVGSLGDLASLELMSQSKTKMVHVAYASEPDVLLALVRGDIQSAFVTPVAALSMIRSGQVKALAVSSAVGLSILSDLPPVARSELAGYDVTGWNAVFAPAGTPPAIVATLNAAVTQALADPELVTQFRTKGVEPLGCSPADLAAAVRGDTAAIHDVLKAAGIDPS